MKIVILILFFLILSGVSSAQTPNADRSTFTPIVDMKLKGFLGGAKNGKWIKTAAAASLFEADSEFVLIDTNIIEEGGVTSGNKLAPEVPCEEFYRVKFDLDSDTGIAVGSGATWNLLPRAPQKLENENKTYQEIIKTFLARKGLPKTPVKIQQIFKVDLEGDAQDEIVIAGTLYKNGVSPSAAAGDYSFVLVRKVSGKKVEEILLDGDFIKKDVKFGAPNSYKISAIADLNGDGKMEIVVFGEYYEGAFSSVYEISGNKAAKVLETGCGV